MRGFVIFLVNGKRYEFGGSNVFVTLASFLRRQGLVGTKIVCNEGDCGACTVMCGKYDETHERFVYHTLDSCIAYLFQLDGCHVVTVEGLRGERLHPVQEALIRSRGAQCGYCTPGFVMSALQIFEDREELTERRIKNYLTGNLCRCTGYQAIIEGVAEVHGDEVPRLESLFPSLKMANDLGDAIQEPISIESDAGVFHAPQSLDHALDFLKRFDPSWICAGGTDIGVILNKTKKVSKNLLSLHLISGLAETSITDQFVEVGASVRISEFQKKIRGHLFELYKLLNIFGSPQIRNRATVAGNLANGSPIGDLIPPLMALESFIKVQAREGERKIRVDELYLGYKKLSMRVDELITQIVIPIPKEHTFLRFYKISRRRDLDISTVNGAFSIEEDGKVRIALGGVAPTVMRALKSEGIFEKQGICAESVKAVQRSIQDEIHPISDVRGEAKYKRGLIDQMVTKFYWDYRREREGVGISV